MELRGASVPKNGVLGVPSASEQGSQQSLRQNGGPRGASTPQKPASHLILIPTTTPTTPPQPDTAEDPLKSLTPPHFPPNFPASDDEFENLRIKGPNAVQLVKTTPAKAAALPPIPEPIRDVIYDMLNALAAYHAPDEGTGGSGGWGGAEGGVGCTLNWIWGVLFDAMSAHCAPVGVLCDVLGLWQGFGGLGEHPQWEKTPPMRFGVQRKEWDARGSGIGVSCAMF